jgi:hypothetical protein
MISLELRLQSLGATISSLLDPKFQTMSGNLRYINFLYWDAVSFSLAGSNNGCQEN